MMSVVNTASKTIHLIEMHVVWPDLQESIHRWSCLPGGAAGLESKQWYLFGLAHKRVGEGSMLSDPKRRVAWL